MDNYVTAVDTFQQLLERVRERQLPLISLRPKEISEAAAYEGDYDLFLPPQYMDELFRIVFDLAVEKHSSFTINRYKHGKAVIVLHNRADNRSIFLEIWNMLSVKEPHNQTIRYIFPDQLESHILPTKSGEFAFSLEVEALYYLSHLFTGGKKLTTELVRYRVSYYQEVLRKEGSKYAQWYDDLAEGKSDIKSAAHLANMELVGMGILFSKKNIGAVMAELTTKIAASRSRFKRQWLRALKIIPVVGPDGVGKTSLIETLIQKSSVKAGYFRFKKLFRSSPFYRLVFPLFQRSLSNEFGGKVSIGKSEVDDRYASVVFSNALMMYPFRIISNFLSGRLMFSDRYFHDYLLTNIRLRGAKAGLRTEWKKWLCRIPQQYWFIHLDASTEVILSRKTELNEEGVSSYRYDIFTAYLEKPFMIYSYVNTESTPEHCADLLMEIADKIADIKL